MVGLFEGNCVFCPSLKKVCHVYFVITEKSADGMNAGKAWSDNTSLEYFHWTWTEKATDGKTVSLPFLMRCSWYNDRKVCLEKDQLPGLGPDKEKQQILPPQFLLQQQISIHKSFWSLSSLDYLNVVHNRHTQLLDHTMRTNSLKHFLGSQSV